MRGNDGAPSGGLAGSSNNTDGRTAPGKSPSPLSPSPTLPSFRSQSGSGYGPSSSLSLPQPQGGSGGGYAYGRGTCTAVGIDGHRQRSPTTLLQLDNASGNNTNTHRTSAPGNTRHVSDGRRSPLTTTSTQYMPPPPMRATGGGPGRRNIFDDDANAEAVSPPYALAGGVAPSLANPNSTVSGSVSPLSEGRFGYLAHNSRPMTATVLHNSPLYGRPPGPAARTTTTSRGSAGGSEARAAGPVQRAASSVSFPRPLGPKISFYSNCGVVVDELDAKTGCLVNQYRCGLLLGSGGFAAVYEFTNIRTKERYACKVIDKSKLGSHGEEKVRMEVEMHRRMEHPNIVRLFNMFSDDYYFYIILELCSSKNLLEVSNARKALPLAEVQHILRQLTRAVQYMHERRIIHRDIKLGNIMIDFSGNVKIGDFGFANELARPNERKVRLCGTPNYIAPEILACSETKVGYGFEVDIWSLGVLLFILAFGYPPFEAEDVPSTYARIRNMDYEFPPSPPSPGGGDATADSDGALVSCKEIICSMLQRDPARRPTPRQILESPFLRLRTASGDAATPSASVPKGGDSTTDRACRPEQSEGEAEQKCASGVSRQHIKYDSHHFASHRQGFTPLQQLHCGSRLVLSGVETRHWCAHDPNSPFAASPVLRQSPYTCERGSTSPYAVATRGVDNGGGRGKQSCPGKDELTAAAYGSEVRELFARRATDDSDGGDAHAGPCKTIHEFLVENDPSSATTTAVATTGSEHTTDTDVDGRPQEHSRDRGQCTRPPLHCQGDVQPRQHRERWSWGSHAKKLPPPPAVYLRNAMFAFKYGYGFTICDTSGRSSIAMLFNDHTKLVFEAEVDTVHYFTRVRREAVGDEAPAARGPSRSAAGPDRSGRSASTVAGTKEGDRVASWCDQPHVFPHASRALRPDTPTAADQGGRPTQYTFPAQKKFAITNFLSPFLSGERRDAAYPLSRSSLKHLGKPAYQQLLFSDGDTADVDTMVGGETEASVPLCVKVSTMTSLAKLMGSYAEVDMSLMAARFSNHSCQVTVMCSSPCPVILIPTAESGVVPRDARWRFDILVYPPYHAVFGIETEHSRFYESFADIRKDVRTTNEGRVFFAAGTTSACHREFMLPEEFLYVLVELLKTVRCPEDVVDCFVYRR